MAVINLNISAESAEELAWVLKGLAGNPTQHLHGKLESKSIVAADAQTADQVHEPKTESGAEPKTRRNRSSKPKEETKPAREGSENENDGESVGDQGVGPITLDDVRAKFTELARAGLNDKVRSILAEVGASKLSELTSDKFADAIAAADALLGEKEDGTDE